MTIPSAWISWLLPLTILVPALVLATRGLQRAFRDAEDRPALVVAAAALGLALPAAHPAMWFLSDANPLTIMDLVGIAALSAFVALLVLCCGLQALRGGRVTWLAGGLLGLVFFLADRLMVGIGGLEPAGTWQALLLASAAAGFGAVAFGFLAAGRGWLAGSALLASMIAAAGGSLHAGVALASPADPLPATSFALGLAFSVAIALLARRTAERRVAGLREDVMGWLAQMADATPEATAVIQDGRIAAVNPAFLALLGQSEELVQGRALADLFPREGQAWWEAARQGRLSDWSRARLLTGAGLTTVETAIRPLRGTALRCQALICRDLTGQLETEARMQYLTRHDALTGLRNRAELLEALDRQISQSRHAGTGFAVLQLGMDDFRVFNDLHGQGAGDLVLREAAQRIIAAVGPDLPAARTGGDEFTLLLPAGEGAERPDRVAERLVARLHEPYLLGAEHLQVSASLGLAAFPRDADHAGELLAMADLAMQRAKTQGGGRVAQADAERDAEARAARVLEQDLRLAVQNRQLRVWLQPQARTSDLAPVGFEALIRWQHPVHGLIPPDRFIPIAEASGLVHEIGAWVMRESMRQAASWPQPLRIAINVSPLQLQRGELPALVRGALEVSGLLPERVEIEITESVLIDQGDAVLTQLHDIRALGVRISLDDFGAGYSSLATLRAFPFDKMKMDRSFLRELETSPEAEAVVRAVLTLGRALRMSVVAEGVQTLHQLEFLRAEGCDLLQGYLLGAPAPADRFASVIEHGRFDDELAAKIAGHAPVPDEAVEAPAELDWEPPAAPVEMEASAPTETAIETVAAPVATAPAAKRAAAAPKPRTSKAAAPVAPAAAKARDAKAPAAKPVIKGSERKAPEPQPKTKAKQPAVALRVATDRLGASEVPPSQRQERQQQERREGNAVAQPLGGRARQEAQPATAPHAQKGSGQQGQGQRPAEIREVDGRQNRAKLDVAPAHQPKAPRPPQRQQADARLKGQDSQRRVAPERPAQQDKRATSQDGRVRNAAAPQVAKGRDAAPGRQRQQPEQHSARAPSSAPAARIGRKAAAPQQAARGPGGRGTNGVKPGRK